MKKTAKSIDQDIWNHPDRLQKWTIERLQRLDFRSISESPSIPSGFPRRSSAHMGGAGPRGGADCLCRNKE